MDIRDPVTTEDSCRQDMSGKGEAARKELLLEHARTCTGMYMHVGMCYKC